MTRASRRSTWFQRGAALLSLGIAISGCAQVIGADFDATLAFPRCGDGICNGGETAGEGGCPADCQPRCGDGNCDRPQESVCTCQADCGDDQGCGDGCCAYADLPNGMAPCPGDCALPCGNGLCEPDSGESCATCHLDCACAEGTECRADPDRSVREQCRAINGAPCADSSECGSGNCVGGFCCGLPCGPCQECDKANSFSGCVALAADDACPGTNVCVDGVCQCGNGTQDGGEIGVDCGGPCDPCE